MKKASSIVLLISGILTIFGLVAYLIVSIVHFAMGGFMVAVQNGTISYADVPESVWTFIDSIFGNHVITEERTVYMFTHASVYLVFALFCIPAAVLAFAARNKNSTGLYICCIIFGVLSATGLATIGGVLGIIANAIENSKQQNAQKEEPKPEEPKEVEAPKEEAPVEEPKEEEKPDAVEEKPEEPQEEQPKEEPKAE